MKPNLGISEFNAQSVVQILNQLLADEYLLYTKTRNYHWNVTGMLFHDLHKFFESQYEQLDEMIDEVAERARTLGGRAVATLQEFAKNSRLSEQPGRFPSDQEMLKELLTDHETLIRHLREELALCMEKYQDAGTSDFLTGLMEQHEKMAWMLRAFFEGK